MKKINARLISNIVVTVLCAVLYLALIISLFINYGEKWYIVLACGLLGLLGAVILNSVIHELCHVIAGAIAGLKPYSVTFGPLFIGKTPDGKFKIKFVKSNELGYTEFIPKTAKNPVKKYVVSACAGLMGTLILLAVQLIIGLLTKSLIVYTIVGISFPVTLYFLLINAIPVFKGNDGEFVYKYFAGGKEWQSFENYMTAVAQIYQGAEPKDVESALLINDAFVGIKYLRYLAYLSRDEERAIKEIYDLTEVLDDSDLSIEIKKEIFFSAILLRDDIYVTAHAEEIISLLEKQLSPQDFRIHGAYRLYNGETAWAKLLLQSGISFAEKYINKGVSKSEKNYMEHLLSETE